MTGRRSRLLAAAALAAAALGVAAPSTPATPAACSSSCTVRADTNTGYVSPVLEIASGTEVTWTPTGDSHPTAESHMPGEPCFLVPVGVGAQPVPVLFEASAEGVTATHDITMGSTVTRDTKPCTSAQPVGDTAWAVTYQCRLHFWMNGTVIVDR